MTLLKSAPRLFHTQITLRQNAVNMSWGGTRYPPQQNFIIPIRTNQSSPQGDLDGESSLEQ